MATSWHLEEPPPTDEVRHERVAHRPDPVRSAPCAPPDGLATLEQMGGVDEVRVLVVDDQAPFRDAAAAVLASMDGFRLVATAASAEDALDLVESERPDLVLMDVELPGLSGTEATRRIVQHPEAPVVVLVSTYDPVELAEDARECGAAAYLPKSVFGADELHSVWSHRDRRHGQDHGDRRLRRPADPLE